MRSNTLYHDFKINTSTSTHFMLDYDPMDWDRLPLTRGILIAIEPIEPQWVFDMRVRAVTRQIDIIANYCAERGINMPDTSLLVDPWNRVIEIEHRTEADTLRWHQIVFRLRQEYEALIEEGEL